MASYRYERDIQPGDLKPRREKQYTRKERWANWWDYNLKWVILIGIAVAFVAYNFIGQYFFTTKADYNVAVVAPYYLPEDTVNALQTQLAQFGEDRNGDGKVVVTLNVYTLDYSNEETQTESAAYLTMAGSSCCTTRRALKRAPVPCATSTAACLNPAATATGGTWSTGGPTAPP